MSYFVYILRCSDKSYYTGVTNNIQKRVYEHSSGLIKGYTFKRLPIQLVYFQEFLKIIDAISYEKQLKGWRRDKKEALIEGDINRLKKLSKSYFNHPSSSSG